jgi:hypothetical protein
MMSDFLHGSIMSHFDIAEQSQLNEAMKHMRRGAYVRIKMDVVFASVDGVPIVDRPTPIKLYEQRMLLHRDTFLDTVVSIRKGA